MTLFTGLEVDPGESLADTAAQSGIIDLRQFRKAEEALFNKFGLKPRVIHSNNQAVGIGCKANVLGKVEMPSGMGGVNGVVRYTVVDSPGVPPLTPVSLLKQLGARVQTSTGTSCSSSQSMGINGHMRQQTRERGVAPSSIILPQLWHVHTEKQRPKRKQKRRAVPPSVGERLTSSMAFQPKKRQRLSKVLPRSLCVQDRFRTDHPLLRIGPRWDDVHIDQGVPRRGRQFLREKYQLYRRWRFGDWFWWPTRWPKDEHVARTRQWLSKSNSQQRLDSSDASLDVQPRVGRKNNSLSGSSFVNTFRIFSISSSSQRHPIWSRGRCSSTPARTGSPLGAS